MKKYDPRLSLKSLFAAVLPYSQYIYAEGMTSTRESQWIAVNNHFLQYFGGVPALFVCDNCKQAVIADKDWIAPELNKDYAEWAEHNHIILPSKVRKPRYKSSVENAVGILEKGLFYALEDSVYFSLEQFNNDLWIRLERLNNANIKKKDHRRTYYWEAEREDIMSLPKTPYEYMERKICKVSSDYHIRFDNAYYSVGREYLHKEVLVRASVSTVKIFSKEGKLICQWPRATSRSQWSTDPNHLPPEYKGFSEWNGTYFTKKAMTIGPKTVSVIQRILTSRKFDLMILDDFLLYTLTDEREVKLLFEILEKRSEMKLSTFICSQREPSSWSFMILNDKVSANAILKRAMKHYTVVFQPKTTV